MEPHKPMPYNEPPPPYPGQASAAPMGPGFYPDLNQGQAPQYGGQAPPFSTNVPQLMICPPGPVQGTTVIVTRQGFGPYPSQTTCPNCSQNVMTSTMSSPGLLTWILSGTLLLIGCWAGCCLIPCCVPECQDVEHRCPNCKTHLGTYKRI
ncbi:Lipopolysaccharide-induced tumor necrosis factor-alpha factor -like protein [Halotydeus destructor]|nr:Lipopolysaccharide-induced tumor necrosis factor-alpha factor -like protein [Halotydeus destructor]